MISIWHLAWIIPTASVFGFMLRALLGANKLGDDDYAK